MLVNIVNLTENDTIAAICTAPGGAIAILRISGPEALTVLNKLTYGKSPVTAGDARKALLRHLLSPDGEHGIALFMPGPHSYTGEDVAEIQCHGGSFAPGRLLRAALESGARAAEGGEFTRRAFLNGKVDLTQAEAVADLINAQSRAAGLLAEKQMAGRLGNTLRSCRETLIRLQSEVESRMDFPEEDLDWMAPEEIAQTLGDVSGIIRKMLDSARAGALIRDGIRLVIAGAPNAGKSSLLNALLGYDRAIVTPVAGTTRDTLEESISIRGIRIRATDTAGLRSADNDVERIGVERTKKTMASADLIIWLMDVSEPSRYAELIRHFHEECPPGVPVILCWNKTDLPHDIPPVIPEYKDEILCISASKGKGIEELSAKIEEKVWAGADRHESENAVSERHAAQLADALPRLERAAKEIREEEWELGASEIRQAVYALGMITGETASPDILDEIFSRFCIGK